MLYGLKQSPQMWNKKIDDYLVSQGFTRLNSDHSVYIHWRVSDDNDKLAIIALYIDDLILLTNSITTMNTLKLELSSKFEMKDCSELHHCLGLNVNRDCMKWSLLLDQSHLDRKSTRLNSSHL